MALVNPKYVLPASASWRPTGAQFATWKAASPTDLWRANSANGWEDLDEKPATATPVNHVTWEWTNQGWVQVPGKNTCVTSCVPTPPAPSTIPMPVGMQIKKPC